MRERTAPAGFTDLVKTSAPSKEYLQKVEDIAKVLAHYDISFDTSFFGDVVAKFAGLEITDKAIRCVVDRNDRFSPDKVLTFEISELTVHNELLLYKFFETPDDFYCHGGMSYKFEIQEKVLMRLAPQFIDYVENAAKNNPKEIYRYQQLTRQKLNNEFIRSINEVINDIIYILSQTKKSRELTRDAMPANVTSQSGKSAKSDDSDVLDKLICEIAKIKGCFELEEVRRDFYSWFRILPVELANLCSAYKTIIEEISDLSHHLDKLKTTLEKYIEYNDFGLKNKVHYLFSCAAFEEFIVRYGIDIRKCDVLEDFLFIHAGIKDSRQPSPKTIPALDEGNILLKVHSITTEEANQFFDYLQQQDPGVVSYRKTETSYNFRINYMGYYKNIYPQFLEWVQVLQQNEPARFDRYQKLSGTQPKLESIAYVESMRFVEKSGFTEDLTITVDLGSTSVHSFWYTEKQGRVDSKSSAVSFAATPRIAG